MKKYVLFGVFIAMLYGCKSSPSANQLYGKWKYIKSEQPNANPPDSTSSGDLKIEDPSIQFFKDNTLQIWWGGKMISHGKFTVEDRKIQYTETLPDGSTRKFPFWIMDFTGKQLVFYTTGEDGTRITAVRV
jgi:hypothetical protein